MIKSLNGYEPVDSAVLTSEELNRTLLTMVGPARAASVSDKPMKWSVRAEGVATLAVVAVRRGEGLSMRVMRTGDGTSTGPRSPQTPAPIPAGGTPPPLPPVEATPDSTASGASDPIPPEAPAPVRVTDMVPPPVAPLIPPVRRPSVSGLRVIKATSTQAQPPAQKEGTLEISIDVEPATPPPPPAEALAVTPASGTAALLAPPPPEESTPALGIKIEVEPPQSRPEPPPRTRPDFWRDLPALMEEARRVGASDLHVVAGRPALLRVAGELKPDGEVLPPKKVEQWLLPLVPARLRDTLERDGSCDFAFQSEASGRFRVNVCRQRTGLKGSFRVIPKELPTLESLGLPMEIAKATRHAQGLILLTGPSGHGKTSTLTALVDILNRETKRHILTVEDPVEYVHARRRALVSQREVGTHTRSFASALKGALREDPNVIVVGELRDAETVRLALTASETGHLLIGTMNAPSAAKTLDWIIELFPSADQPWVRLALASHLRMIVHQRLVPSRDGLGLEAAAEVLPGSVALGNLIREGRTSELRSLWERSEALGIIRLDESLAHLVRRRKVTLELARSFAEDPDGFDALVAGRPEGASELPPEPSSGGRMKAPAGSLLGRQSA
ncbi:MAG: PilT/PilU family type 4a pilus ATPase [Myxococcaceae bacterium]|nr:PilT/PilU family type 4a pilus ATPase [Myxococcaceae bacterium]